MKIKTLNGEKEISSIEGLENIGDEFKELKGLWVRWEDIKPILDELQGELARYQSAIENDKASLSCESVGCSDYGLMK